MYNVIKNISSKTYHLFARVKNALTNRKAESYTDTGVKILTAIVLGSMLLVFLYSLFGKTIFTQLSSRILALINYNG